MDLIPRSLTVGLFAPTIGIPGGQEMTQEDLNRIWSEIAPDYGYRRLEFSTDGTAARMIGDSERDLVVIQPPLLQVTDPISLTEEKSADKAESILKAIARHLGTSEFHNLGVQWIYHAPAPNKDGAGFLMTKVLRSNDEDVSELKTGGPFVGGVKYIVEIDQATHYTLVIEPLLSDNEYLFLDLAAQFDGPITLDLLKKKAGEAETWLKGPVQQYLDRLLKQQ